MSSEDKIFDIEFQSGGRSYKGWVNPSDKLSDTGLPASFHVVLNNVFFGNLSLSAGKWNVDEDRPDALVDAAGREISRWYMVRGKQ